MATAFAQLFWGFLFTMIDFRINRFDLLPDVVGYILVVLACNELRRHNPRFNVAFAIAIPQLVLAAIELLGVGGIDFSFVGTRPVDPLGSTVAAIVTVGLIMFVLDLVMVYHVCSGIWEMADARGLRDLEREAHSRWTLYLVMALSGIVVFLTAAASAYSGTLGGAIGLFVLFFVFGIVVTVLFLIMLRHAQHQIPATEPAL